MDDPVSPGILVQDWCFSAQGLFASTLDLEGPAEAAVGGFPGPGSSTLISGANASDAPASGAARHWGHFGLHRSTGARHRLARDPLGVNKLFFALDNEGGVQSNAFLIELLQAGHPLQSIASVPSGHVVTLDLEARTAELTRFSELPWGEDDADLEGPAWSAHAQHIRARLEEVFGALRGALDSRTVYVTLSGGLDSSTIAALAQAHLPHVTGITFSIVESSGALSEDALAARRVAEALGMDLVEVLVSREDILRLLDDTLVYGQDFRDFNVHCGLVNAALAEALAERHRHQPSRPVVLTGDTMNELLADYSPVSYAGRAHYELPRLSPGRARRYLVQGLDAGDREVGIFARFGVDCVQPYALCADAYASLPGGVAEHDRAKQRLAQEIMGDAVPSFVYERKKVRAQVGGECVGGTLAALTDAGFDSSALRRRFAELMGLTPGDENKLMFSGRYRYRSPFS